MTEEEKEKSKKREISIATCEFEFKITSDEAYQILHNKNGKIAKNMRKYLSNVLEHVAKKCLEDEKKNKNCK